MEGTVNCTVYRLLTVSTRCNIIEHEVQSQGAEEMCLSLEHQKPSKTFEKWVILIALQFRYTFYRPQTKRLRARKSLGRSSGDSLRSPLGQRSVRQQGYGLRLLIFKIANNKVDLVS